MRNWHIVLAAAALSAATISLSPAWADSAPPATGPATTGPATTAPATRPAPKALSEEAKKGLAWLAKQQLESGAWGQGEESAQMGGGSQLAAVPNVADTSMAVLALLRGGNSPTAGEYKEQVKKAVAFICSQIEESDEKSLFITAQRSTRTQQKLGTYIDTFLAAQVLGELRNKMGDEAANKRVLKALDKAVGKIELNQKDDGKWANDGWAPTLMQGQAAKAINTITANGGKVNEVVRERVEKNAQGEASGKLAAGGNAGVPLYSKASQLSSLQNAENGNAARRQELEATIASPAATQAAKDDARKTLARYEENTKALAAAQNDIAGQLADDRFIAGFGSNGGEEFLSYLNIGESLYQKGGEEWQKWDAKMAANLNKVQNADGSWSGHHCITGRTFCTSAALMVLMVDRSPEGTAAKLSEKHR